MLTSIARQSLELELTSEDISQSTRRVVLGREILSRTSTFSGQNRTDVSETSEGTEQNRLFQDRIEPKMSEGERKIAFLPDCARTLLQNRSEKTLLTDADIDRHERYEIYSDIKDICSEASCLE